jgi:uncharacterized delta-60 repeat protein
MDSTYGSNGIFKYTAVGIDNELTSVTVLPNGNILAAGHYMQAFTGATNFDAFLLQTTATGTAAAGFGSNGAVITPVLGGIDDLFGLAVDTAGNFVVAGYTTQPFGDLDMLLQRYLPNGTLDNSFGTNGSVIFDSLDYDVAYDLTIQSDGKLVVAGSVGGPFLDPKAFAVWRYLHNGQADTSWGGNGLVTTNLYASGVHEFNSIDIDFTGKIVGAGKAFGGVNNNIGVVRYLNPPASTGGGGGGGGGGGIGLTENTAGPVLYPHPANQRVSLAFPVAEPQRTMQVFNVAGACVHAQSASDLTTSWDVTNWPSGIYTVLITSQQGQSSTKLVVVH